ncbi:MAG TPA: DMT family transporter [Myxococcales bacterium]|nr:DMT family transporter [Myxococcales bacterium]
MDAPPPPCVPGVHPVHLRARHATGALGTAAAILYVFLWASAFVPSRILAHSAPPLSILWIRFLFAGSVLFAGARAARLPLPSDRGTWVRLLLLGSLGNACYLGLNYEALRHLSAGMGSIVASTNPLILALLAPWLLREPLTARKLAGLLLGFGGVVLAMYTRAATQEARPIDVALSAIGVLAFVFSNILYKRMHLRPHPVVLNAAQLFLAGAALLPVALIVEGPPRIDWTWPVVGSLAYLVVVLSIGASMLWFWILQHGEASRVSAFFFLTPVFGLLLGALLLGEPLARLDAVALAVIAFGLWLTTRG